MVAYLPVPSERGIDIRRFPWIRKLAADYVFSFPDLAPFFAGDPGAPASWRAAIARAQSHPHPRREVAALLRAQQRRRGAAPAAMAATARLEDPHSVAVVTGQQAGLFGGPVYTVLKALTAVKLADRVTREYAVPAVAIFWIEAEDHDWDEVSSCSIIDAELQRRTVALPPPAGAGHAPVGRLALTADIDAAIEALAAGLPRTEFTEPLIQDLRRAYCPGVGMAEAFGRWMETLTSRFGLIIYDASDPAAKPLATRVFSHEAQHPSRTGQLAHAAGAELVARGYHQQVASQDGPALFRLDGARTPIRAQGDHLLAGETELQAMALQRRVEEHPSEFSPGVLLRPIVQDTLFPTVCYVSGPNELGYLAQLRGVYEHFGLPMPLVYPRISATVLDHAAARFLAKYDVPLEALQPQDDRTLNRLLASALPETVERAMAQAAENVRASMEVLIAAVPAVDPTLEGAARATLGKLEHDLGALQGKIINAAKKRNETLRRQLTRAQAQAFPDGQPQERAIGLVSLLDRYGPALVDTLLEELPLEPGLHWVLTL